MSYRVTVKSEIMVSTEIMEKVMAEQGHSVKNIESFSIGNLNFKFNGSCYEVNKYDDSNSGYDRIVASYVLHEDKVAKEKKVAHMEATLTAQAKKMKYKVTKEKLSNGKVKLLLTKRTY